MTNKSSTILFPKSMAGINLLSLLICVFLLSSCSTEEVPRKVSLFKRAGDEVKKAEASRQPSTLWFGFDLRLGPKEEVMIYTPFLQYLEKSTGKRFRIKFTDKYEDTVSNLGLGKTHFAALGALNYVIGADKFGIKYLVSGVNREGDARYNAMIITGPDSSIHDLGDIKGKCFAFGSEMSTQGHLIPRQMLEDAGIGLDDLGKHIYTGSHINAVKAVLNGECDAGGIQDTLANRLFAEGKVRILKRSIPYPSSLIAYNTSVDPKIVSALKKALLAFEPTEKHKDSLYGWDKTEMPLGFTKIDELELDKVRALARKYGILKNVNDVQKKQ